MVGRPKVTRYWPLCFMLVMTALVAFFSSFGSSRGIAPISKPTLPEDPDELQERLVCFEKNWKRKNVALEKAEREAGFMEGKYPSIAQSGPSQESVFWSYFKPNFECPLEVEQVGGEGHGGKAVCGFKEIERLSNCTVYSFGIKADVSFEKAVLERTSCKLRMFDLAGMIHSVAQLPEDFPARALYYQRGLGPNDNSLKAIMKEHKDDFVHLIKMDVEGAEWLGVEEAAKDFEHGIPVGQLHLELHVNFSEKTEYKAVRKLFNLLQNTGLRPFSRQPDSTSRSIYEYAFLSVKFGMFKIVKPPFDT